MRGAIAALALLLAPATAAQVVENPSGPPVKTSAGLVAGKTLPSGVRAWHGVPFAAPPVRDRRWRDPEPVAAWAGVRNADRFAPACPQPLRSRAINHYFGEEATSEDCLYLNIWAPPGPPPAGTRYPVVVWIYGGGFNIGSASMANYSGEALARRGVVYVAPAYRVGPLGFLAHPELSAEKSGRSGNYGLHDQLAALRWVQDNIAAFGGDAGNVTLAGQSAGSMSVALLQASPARGLFHRVVGMSGSPFNGQIAPVPLAQAEAQGKALQAAMGATSIEAMRDVPADQLLAAATAGNWRPSIAIDGVVVAEAPAASFAARRQNDVPAMIGFTRDESFRSLGPIGSVADYQAAVRSNFPDSADELLHLYPANDAASARRAARDIERDSTLGRQMDGWARAQNANGSAPVYAWLFDRVHPYHPGISFADHDPATVGAYHTADVPYWLGTLDSLNRFRVTRDWTPADRALSEAMMDRLVTFARTGKPGAGWPAWEPSDPQLMVLGLEMRVADWPNVAALPLLGAPLPPPAQRQRARD